MLGLTELRWHRKIVCAVRPLRTRRGKLAHLVRAVLHQEDVWLPDLVVLGQGVQRVVRPGHRAVKTDKLSQHYILPLCVVVSQPVVDPFLVH